PLNLLRYQYLEKQLVAVQARIEMLQGRKLTFDEESAALYDATAPAHPESWFQERLAEVDALLPGPGALIDRYATFRSNFVVPPEKLDAVFGTAIEECRRRTGSQTRLPEGESFRVEYVRDKAWSAYNWYQGKYHSLIQVNIDFPIYVDRIIDLAAHEGYPGHHVYNALLEEHLVRKRKWVEFTVYPLFSPQSLIAEGTANYGIDVAFPGRERIEYEQSVLFPLAGLEADQAESYYRIHGLLEQLNFASNEAARLYLGGQISSDQAARWLTRNSLMPPDRAQQRVKFIEKYRSYVINYNLGKDMVARYIESRGGTSDNPQKRWEEFLNLISSPRLPSGLQ
ncbi:MAG TPA: hypothetical protein VLR94_01400, partial [Acidobacteriota bacterium]|nr:hypothetical protein [Acidobacteriota bacterium]